MESPGATGAFQGTAVVPGEPTKLPMDALERIRAAGEAPMSSEHDTSSPHSGGGRRGSVFSSGSFSGHMSLTRGFSNQSLASGLDVFAPEDWLRSEMDSIGGDPKRRALYEIINGTRFGSFIGALICVNTVVMGVELDQHPMAQDHHLMLSVRLFRDVPIEVFDWIEGCFFAIFFVEYIMRMFVFRCTMLTELSSYIDFAALSPLLLIWIFNLQSSKQLTLLRVVRLLKLFRLLRLVGLFKELRVLASSMASAAKALVWIAVLLLITVFCAAIATTLLIGQNEDYEPDNRLVVGWKEMYEGEFNVRRHWGSVTRSMFTLFQIFTLDNWNQVVRPIIETHQPEMLMFFVVFLFTTSFGLLNLLMGTIVEHAMTAARAAEDEKEKVLKEDYKQVMLVAVKLYSIADKDGDGRLKVDDMSEFLRTHNVAELLERNLKGFKIKLDYEDFIDTCQRICEDWFDPDDTNHERGITVEEFVGAAVRLQGQAKSKHLMAMMVSQKSAMSRMTCLAQNLEAFEANLEDRLRTQDERLDRALAILGGNQHERVVNSAMFTKVRTVSLTQVSSVKSRVETGSRAYGTGAPRNDNPGSHTTGTDKIELESEGSDFGEDLPEVTLSEVEPLRDFKRPSDGLANEDLGKAQAIYAGKTKTFDGAPVQLAFEEPTPVANEPGEVEERKTFAGSSASNDAGAVARRVLTTGSVTGVARQEVAQRVTTAGSVSLSGERKDFQKHGRRLSQLLTQIAKQEEYASTDAIASLRQYSTRRRSQTTGEGAAVGLEIPGSLFASSPRRASSGGSPKRNPLESDSFKKALESGSPNASSPQAAVSGVRSPVDSQAEPPDGGGGAALLPGCL